MAKAVRPEAVESPVCVNRAQLMAAARRALEEGMQIVCEQARANCPVATGALAASIHYRVDDAGGEVYAGEPYGVRVEMGTAHMPARPFLYPAMKANQAMLARRVAAAVAACMSDQAP